MKKNKNKLLVLTAMLTMLLDISLSSNSVTYANFEGFKNNCLTDIQDSDSKNDTGKNTSEENSGSNGSWDEKGTKANKVAQNMWDYWKNKGFSGAGIAGVMGNVDHEGGFEIPDRAEGHFGNNSKENGLSEGNIPTTGVGYPIGKSGKPEGGGGHYQFTPFSKFAPVGDSKWKSTEAQSEYVWTSEVRDASWLNSYIQLDSVEEAVTIWFTKYERGASLNPAKITSGKKAYQVFGGSKIKGDSALANAIDTAKDGENKSEEKAKGDFCYGSNGKVADTKSNTEKSEKAIKLLADTVGKSINNGECYGLTAYYVEKMGGPQLMGSGKMNAWAIGSDYDWESHGWKVVKNPKPSDLKAGDVINWQGGGKIAISSYGHTGIIQSVEGNNTFKTFEQNAEKGRVSAEYTRKYEDNVITSLVRKIK